MVLKFTVGYCLFHDVTGIQLELMHMVPRLSLYFLATLMLAAMSESFIM